MQPQPSAHLDRTEVLTAITLSEMLAALSFALDLTEGAVPGHALRSCLLGLRLADEIQLPAHQRPSLFYALLLKDIGCSSNAARMCAIVGGDDRAIKAGVKLEDWTRLHQPKLSTLSLMWRNVLPTASPLARLARIGKIALSQQSNNQELITLRCDRGASIVRKLGFDEQTASAVRALDEHWDGSGYPDHATGPNIPLLARLCAVAQHLDVFAHARGPQAALTTLGHRSGTWFDPELVRATLALQRKGTLWPQTLPSDPIEETRAAVLALDADDSLRRTLTPQRLDLICEGFADVVDAKSPFTYRHSVGVAAATNRITQAMDLPPERVGLMRRAALLHDLGKLGVPNTILDKPGRLDAAEGAIIELHPGRTFAILDQVPALRHLAAIAGEHHEKLDGSGYPFRRTAAELSLESRILAVADIYGALAEDRPYRPGLEPAEIRSILKTEASAGKIDSPCLDALLGSLEAVPENVVSLATSSQRVPDPFRASPPEAAASSSSPSTALEPLDGPLCT
jgi:HD-GYP domain-containing protein (c-di-GMP phosphodiesterase class II)